MRKLKQKTKNKGFTILEILVVLAIGALILSFVFVSYRDLKAKSRDSRREHDIKQIQNSLDLYVNNAGFIPALPIDPLGGASGVCGSPSSYVYCYQALENGFSYQISYNLETDSILGKSKGSQSASP